MVSANVLKLTRGMHKTFPGMDGTINQTCAMTFSLGGMNFMLCTCMYEQDEKLFFFAWIAIVVHSQLTKPNYVALALLLAHRTEKS